MNIPETVSRVLAGFFDGHASLEQTVSVLKSCYDEVKFEYRDNFFTVLLLRNIREALAAKRYKAVIPILHAWAGFGPVDVLPLYLQGIRGFGPSDVAVWAREIVPVLRLALDQHGDRFLDAPLETIQNDCGMIAAENADQLLGQPPYSKEIINMVTALRQTVEHIQHQRFLRRNIKPQEVRQPKEYDDRLPLYRRRVFDEDLERELHATSDNRPLALVMLDLDYFKTINDEHGHLVGDEVLYACAQIVEDATKGKGGAYRYGGEEFALVLPNFAIAEAVALAERIRLGVEQAKISSKAIKVTISCGVAAATSLATTSGGLINAADQALYQAKHLGRNRVQTAGG